MQRISGQQRQDGAAGVDNGAVHLCPLALRCLYQSFRMSFIRLPVNVCACVCSNVRLFDAYKGMDQLAETHAATLAESHEPD